MAQSGIQRVSGAGERNTGEEQLPGGVELARISADGRSRTEAVVDAIPDPSSAAVVEFSFTRSPTRVREEWEKRHGSPPRDHCVVSVGGGPHGRTSRATEDGSVAVSRVSPYDLTGMGMAWSDALDAVAGADEVYVFFDSVTALLQYASEGETFRFLHLLARQATGAGARGRFLVDPAAHDPRTVNALSVAFDETVDLRRRDSAMTTP